MQSVGTRLREARIKKGYTLEDINARTRISLKNLAAIESDDLSKISSPFTYRSFVRQVSDMVGLDHATLEADALTASSTMPEPLVPGQEEETYARPHQFQQVKLKQKRSWLRTASIAGFAGVVSIYLIWHSGVIGSAKSQPGILPASSKVVVPEQPKPAPPQTEQSQPPQASLPVLVPVVAKSEPKTSASEPPPQPGTEQLLTPQEVWLRNTPASRQRSAPTPEAENAPIHIELSAIQPTWLSVSADGKSAYRGTLAAMQTISFNGKESAQIRTANAGGVNVIFNGHALGTMGRPGQSRTFVFTKSGYEVVHGVGTSTAVPHLSPTGE